MDNKKESSKCFFCKKSYDNINSLSSCTHKICDVCLYEKIFTTIKDFKGKPTITVRCNCEKGFIEKNLNEILKLLKERSEKVVSIPNDFGFEIFENSKEQKNEKPSQYCLDCFQHVCEKCLRDPSSEHYCHRILDYDYIINFTKENISSTNLKNKDLEQFLEKCNEISMKFQENINKNFNNTIQKIDDIVDSALKLKENYINQYKEELGNIILTFKIIKIFYMNFYNDKTLELNKNNKDNNLLILRYLNNISYELSDIEIKHYQQIDEIAIGIKQQLEKMLKFDCLSANFNFEKIKKNFIIQEVIPNAHSKFIHAMALTTDNKIITCGRDCYMKVFKQKEGPFEEIQSLNYAIICALPLKNGKLLTTFFKNNDIVLWELNSKDEYVKKQSMTNHSQPVYSLVELEKKRILSGSKDKTICIWEENNRQQYSVIQKIKYNKPVILSISLKDFKIAFSSDDGIIKIYGAEKFYENKKFITKEFCPIGELNNHTGKVSCMCQLNNEYLISGGSDISKEKKDHNIIVWKPEGKFFVLSQILKDHEADINGVIELRKGGFASSSRDRTIRIFNNIMNTENKVVYFCTKKVDHYAHGLYQLVQLKDDRLCSTATDNNLIIWRDFESLL